MPLLSLNPDELLSTTRAVRRRLDLTRKVDRKVVQECISAAQQAPTGGNRQGWHFVIVTDPTLRMELGKLFRKGAEGYFASSRSAGGSKSGNQKYDAIQARVRLSALYLVEHIHQVPVHVIPCIEGRTNNSSSVSVVTQASKWGSIFPAVWSFMLAARARGLGTTLTSFHLAFEKEAAELLGIPYKEVMQAPLIPLAYTKGTNFHPAPRKNLDSMVHWERW